MSSSPPAWPYPSFAEPTWLRGNGDDAALSAIRQAVHDTLSAKGQGATSSAESLLDGMSALADLRERIDWAMLALAGEARSKGLSWASLGTSLGMSKQAVHKRFGPWVEQALAQAQQPTSQASPPE